MELINAWIIVVGCTAYMISHNCRNTTYWLEHNPVLSPRKPVFTQLALQTIYMGTGRADEMGMGEWRPDSPDLQSSEAHHF